MMTARMMMLNCVQDTSVRAAVVLSVGLLGLVKSAWVVAAALSGVLALPPAVVEVKAVPAVVEGVSDVVVCSGVSRSRGAEERKASVMVSFHHPHRATRGAGSIMRLVRE